MAQHIGHTEDCNNTKCRGGCGKATESDSPSCSTAEPPLPLVDCDGCGEKRVARASLKKHSREYSTELVRECAACELVYTQIL